MQKTTWLRGIEVCRSLQHLATSWHINSCESWEHLWLLALQQEHPRPLVEPWPSQNMSFGKYWKISNVAETMLKLAIYGNAWKCLEMPWNSEMPWFFAIVLVCVAHVVSAHSTSHNSCLACLADFFQQFLYLLWVVGSGESQRVTKDSGVFRHSHFQWLSNPILSQLSHAKSRSDAKSC